MKRTANFGDNRPIYLQISGWICEKILRGEWVADQRIPSLRELGVLLEVNNSSLVKKELRLNCYDNYRRMLRLCEAYRVPVYLASDAHDPSGVGQFDLADALLREVGVDESLLLNRDTGRFLNLIGK